MKVKPLKITKKKQLSSEITSKITSCLSDPHFDSEWKETVDKATTNSSPSLTSVEHHPLTQPVTPQEIKAHLNKVTNKPPGEDTTDTTSTCSPSSSPPASPVTSPCPGEHPYLQWGSWVFIKQVSRKNRSTTDNILKTIRSNHPQFHQKMHRGSII